MSEAACGFVGPQAAALLRDVGPTLKVDLGYDLDYDPRTPARPPTPSTTGVLALIDTGARRSCIDSDLAVSLGLPVVDQLTVSGVAGLARFNLHIAQMHVGSLQFTLVGNFAGVHLATGRQRHAVLIGRDVLSLFRLEYDGLSGAVRLFDPEAPLPIEPWPDE